MICKRVSRNEMLKALNDHAGLLNDCGEIKWDDDFGYYIMTIHGATVFINGFKLNDKLPSMITMFQTVKMPVLGDDKTIDIMIGAINSHDWMVVIGDGEEE